MLSRSAAETSDSTDEEEQVDFRIATETADGVSVIALAGEVDLYTAPNLKEELVRMIDEGARHMVIDFTETSFIDSTTLGVLVSGLKRLRLKDGRLALVITDRNILKIFEITGLDRVFSIHELRAEALDELATAKG
jgi:anti-sigma B factor antagonist